jgi:hypothetical protein
VVAVNTTFRLAPWADALFAMDRKWWDAYAAEVREHFRGECFTSSAECRCHGLRKLPRFRPYGNSGAGAIALAAKLGAARAILLGYDMQKTGGHTHWHGSHPKGLGDAGSLPKWPAQFAALAGDLRRTRGMEVVNASRATALQSFPRASLEELLGDLQKNLQKSQAVLQNRELEEAEA